MPQPRHTNLRSPRFVCLCAANFLVHLSLFALLPQWVWMAGQGDGGPAASACLLPVFWAGMAAPGAAGAFLLERHSRKGVCLRSLLALCLLPLCSAVVLPAGYAVLPFALLYGAAYGLLQISLGSTLLNDILPSSLRDSGDSAFAWAGRPAVALGLLLGTLMSHLLPTAQAIGYALAPAAAAFLVVGQTQIPVKAPVRTPRLSLDRFFLPALSPFLLSLVPAPCAVGLYAAADSTAAAYALLLCGLLAALPFTRLCGRGGRTGKLLLAGGYAALLAGLLPFLGAALPGGSGLAAFLCGAGAGVVTHCHLHSMLRRAAHCQRGTVQNTYLLFWWLSFAAGFAAAA